MNKKILLAAIAGVALTGCECDQSVDVSSAAPGTPGDFKANIKDRVFFNFDSSAVTSEAKEVLAAQTTWLKTYENTNATVVGKADERGTREYNMNLGERRANSVRKALVKMGVHNDRVSVVSHGKDRPEVADATTAEQHAQNRVAITEIAG